MVLFFFFFFFHFCNSFSVSLALSYFIPERLKAQLTLSDTQEVTEKRRFIKEDASKALEREGKTRNHALLPSQQASPRAASLFFPNQGILQWILWFLGTNGKAGSSNMFRQIRATTGQEQTTEGYGNFHLYLQILPKALIP